jgi:hypothetical protein
LPVQLHRCPGHFVWLFRRICRGSNELLLLPSGHNNHDINHVDFDQYINVNNFNQHHHYNHDVNQFNVNQFDNNKQSRPLMLAPWQACPHQKD